MSRIVTAISVFALAARCWQEPRRRRSDSNSRPIGQPLATGLIQKNKEQPFFENFAARTGLPIDVDYKPIDTLGMKDTEQLRVMKAGLFDIVSLRVSQNSRDEPTLLGLDLVGASPDYATGRKVAKAYFDTVDARLQQQFGVKLLGVWPFGPQILFCKKPITKLADIKGMKVRVYDQNLAKFIELVGGTPVPISFADTHQSLSLGVVDCADHRPELGQLGRLARGDDAPAAAGLPDGAERLRDHAEGLEPAQARPAGQAEDRLRRPHRGDLDLLRRAVPGRAELQHRQGPVHHRQEVQADQRAGHRPPTASWCAAP